MVLTVPLLVVPLLVYFPDRNTVSSTWLMSNLDLRVESRECKLLQLEAFRKTRSPASSVRRTPSTPVSILLARLSPFRCTSSERFEKVCNHRIYTEFARRACWNLRWCVVHTAKHGSISSSGSDRLGPTMRLMIVALRVTYARWLVK